MVDFEVLVSASDSDCVRIVENIHSMLGLSSPGQHARTPRDLFDDTEPEANMYMPNGQRLTFSTYMPDSLSPGYSRFNHCFCPVRRNFPRFNCKSCKRMFRSVRVSGAARAMSEHSAVCFLPL